MAENLSSRSTRSGGIREAKMYMTEKEIPQLFESMMTALMYKRPEDHLDFLQTCIDKAKEDGKVHWHSFIDPLPPIPQREGSILSEYQSPGPISQSPDISPQEPGFAKNNSPLPPISPKQRLSPETIGTLSQNATNESLEHVLHNNKHEQSTEVSPMSGNTRKTSASSSLKSGKGSPSIQHRHSLEQIRKSSENSTSAARKMSEIWYLEYTQRHVDTSCLSGKPIIFVLGGPGSGKGTQCSKVVEKYLYTHLSAGDLLRSEVAKGTDIGNRIGEIIKEGQLVPQDVTICLLKQAMVANQESRGFLIDGFPREINQGMQFENEVGKAQLVLFYDCSDDILVARLLARGQSSGRSDDNEETIKKRLDLYHGKTSPVIDHYQSIVAKIPADGSVEEVFIHTCNAIDQIDGSEEEPSSARSDSATRKKSAAESPFRKEDEIVLQRQQSRHSVVDAPPDSGRQSVSDGRTSSQSRKFSAGSRRESQIWFMEYSKREIDVTPILGKPVIFVLGGPGSGKGTQCAKIADKYTFSHFSAGDLLRSEVAKGTEIGQRLDEIMKEGQLVPQDVTISLLKQAMVDAANESEGFLIDGFPRETEQGLQFEKQVCLAKMVLNFECPDEVLVSRLLARAQHSGRVDDNEETIKKCLKLFHEKTSPVVDYYVEIVATINADRPVDVVFKDVCNAIDFRVLGKTAITQPIIFVIGAPCSGKETQCKSMSKKYGFEFISVDRLMVEQSFKSTPEGDMLQKSLTQGQFAPEAVLVDLLKEEIYKKSDSKGFIISGFPQDHNQLFHFEAEIAAPKLIIFYDCKDDVILTRWKNRQQQDGLPDDELTLQKRLQLFNSTTTQLFMLCSDRIKTVNGNDTIGSVFDSSCKLMDQMLTADVEDLQSMVEDLMQYDVIDAAEEAHQNREEVVEDQIMPIEETVLGDQGNTQPLYQEAFKDKRVIFVIGGPGCGKGTQCSKIADKYGYSHLSTGDILRSEVESGSERGNMISDMMGKGELVPQHIVLQTLGDAMLKIQDTKCFLLDGFPRELSQAQEFESMITAADAVLYFSCPSEVMLRRIMGRAQTSGRVDDNEESAMKRLQTFEDQTMPVIKYYQEKEKVKEVAAVASPEEVFAGVCQVLDEFEAKSKMAEQLREKNIIFVLGGPGSGKGTQCAKIVEKYGYKHLSTGDLLREEVKKDTPRAQQLKDIMAKGELVSQDTILELLRDAMTAAVDSKGFLIDGFPRDIPQGEKFEKEIGNCKYILYFDCTNEVMIERLLGRAQTSGRVDDNRETIEKRLKTFEDQTIPVLGQYGERVKRIDAMRDVDPIFADVCNVLDTL